MRAWPDSRCIPLSVNGVSCLHNPGLSKSLIQIGLNSPIHRMGWLFTEQSAHGSTTLVPGLEPLVSRRIYQFWAHPFFFWLEKEGLMY